MERVKTQNQNNFFHGQLNQYRLICFVFYILDQQNKTAQIKMQHLSVKAQPSDSFVPSAAPHPLQQNTTSSPPPPHI